MTARQADLFPGTKKRRPPRRLAHMVDGGPEAIQFKCTRCGYCEWWEGISFAQAQRGIACPRCNPDAGIMLERRRGLNPR